MKKVVTLILAVLLLALPFMISAEQGFAFATVNKDRLNEVADAVEAFLTDAGYKFDKIENGDEYTYFALTFEIDSRFSEIDIEVTAYDDLVTVLSYAKESIPEAKRDAAAAYMMRANWYMLYSHFNLNMNNGSSATYSYIPVRSVLPGTEELDILFHETIWSWEDYGSGLYEVTFEDADPKEAFDKAKAEYDAKYAAESE